MKTDDGRIVVKIPAAIITGLRDEFKGRADELIECELVNYQRDDYNTVALSVRGRTNPKSSYGYYYTKRKELERFLERGEFVNMENKEFNYYYKIEYMERGTVKLIPSNKLYNVGDYLVITSESANYCIGKVVGILTKEQADERKTGICYRRIVSKVEDTYGIKLAELQKIQLDIKAINHTISDKYLLILLRNETTPELDAIKDRLTKLLETEKVLKRELEKYE